MKLTINAVLLTLSASALAAVCPVPQPTCPTGSTQMCCQNLNENYVGYYCAQPDAPFPCTSSPALTALCCESYDLTPRGYTGSQCHKPNTPPPPPRVLTCAAEKPKRLCCTNGINENGVASYCSPNASFPCGDNGDPERPLIAACCETEALTARGYTGEKCVPPIWGWEN